jgi:hypothetical protein
MLEARRPELKVTLPTIKTVTTRVPYEVVCRENKIFDSVRARVLGRYGKAQSSDTDAEWIAKNTLLKGRPFSFKDHEYQIQPLNDSNKRLASHKPAQVGWTEIFVRWAVCKSVKFQGFTTIFTQPTKQMAEDFSKGRAKDAIEACEAAQRLLRGGDLDSAQVKRIGLSYLYFKGTVGKSSAISVPADALIHDETNFSAPDTLDKFKSRIQHSEWAMVRNVSTPTIPKFGVSAMFEDSDKKHIQWRCACCGTWQILKWPDSIWFKYHDGWRPAKDEKVLAQAKAERRRGEPIEARYKCHKCESVIERRDTVWNWVAEVPGAEAWAGGVSGYSMSWMDVLWKEPWDVICASDPDLKGYKHIADFFNFVLGQPHLGAKDGITEHDFTPIVDAACPQRLRTNVSFVGIDIGKTCHVSIYEPTWGGQLLIPRQYTFDGDKLEAEVDSIIENFNPLAVVLDAMPYELDVDRVITKHKGLCYKTRFKGDKFKYDDAIEEITVPRTKYVDLVVDGIRSRRYHYLGDVSETIKHFENIARIQEEDEVGNLEFSWINVGPDHFVFSQVYAELAKEIVEFLAGMDESGVVLPTISGVRTEL